MPFRPAVPYMKQTKHTSTLKFILVMFNVRMIPQYRNNHTMSMKGVGVLVFNTTFNDISVISWLSVLLVEETGVPGGNHRASEKL